MISTIRISDPTKTPIAWLPKVKFLSEPRDYEFTPGLNILWGKNGSGKSTLLRLIARLFHAEQGRVSTITQHSLEELFGHFADKKDRLAGVAVSHDGQGIVFYDPSDKVGLIGGGAAFDDDFFMAGVSSMMMKGSSGELTLNNLGSAMASIKDAKYVKPTYKVNKTQYSGDTRNKQIEVTERFFEKDMEPGRTTVIFDEPDRSIDIPSQQQMWNAFARFDKVQLIVATHSAFAANIPTANYIESSPGYLEQCRKAIKTLGL